MKVHRNFSDILSEIGIALLGSAPVAVGLVVRSVFFPKNFVLSQISSLENVGLLFGMVFLALAVFWVLDTYNFRIWGNILFVALLVLSLVGILILIPCTYTGEISLASFDIPIPLSISLVSLAVFIMYTALFLFLHVVWEEWCTEYVTATVLLFAAIFSENMVLSLFTLSFALVIVVMIRGYGKHYNSSLNVVIYRFGKPVRKRTLTFLVIPFIEKFKSETEARAIEKG